MGTLRCKSAKNFGVDVETFKRTPLPSISDVFGCVLIALPHLSDQRKLSEFRSGCQQSVRSVVRVACPLGSRTANGLGQEIVTAVAQSGAQRHAKSSTRSIRRMAGPDTGPSLVIRGRLFCRRIRSQSLSLWSITTRCFSKELLY
jgi:hypothetical protein